MKLSHIIFFTLTVFLFGCGEKGKLVGEAMPALDDQRGDARDIEPYRRWESPTAELDELIRDYEGERKESPSEEVALAEARVRWMEVKAQGHRPWGSKDWMKERSHYESLDTIRLAEECFERLVLGMDLMAYDDLAQAFLHVEIFHEGYAELFQREDMWEGILHIQSISTSKLDPEAPMKDLGRLTHHFNSVNMLYVSPRFKRQVRGREKMFLDANMKTLKAFKSFLEVRQRKPNESLAFWAIPVGVSQRALLLTKQINLEGFESIIGPIKAVRWEAAKQDRQDLIEFLGLVISSIEKAVQ